MSQVVNGPAVRQVPVEKMVMEQPLDRDHPSLESIRGLPVLDADTHLTEPADTWTSRAPEKYKGLVPRVEWFDSEYVLKVLGWTPGVATRYIDENTRGKVPIWLVGEDIVLGYAGTASAVNKDGVKVRGADFIRWPLTEASPGAMYVEPRLAMMDDVGIWGQIVYPNAVGFGGQNFARIEDPELRMLCLTLWNDAMGEMQQASGGRLNGMGIVPWWDREGAVREIERIHAMGLHGVNLNADPQNQGMPDLSDEYFEPMWEALEGLDLPVNFHIGASVSQASYSGNGPWPSFDDDRRLAIGSTMLYLGNARILSNFIFSGLLDRHPRLKIVSVESGLGWIPFILDALDYQAVENSVTNLELKPSEYFKRQMYACFWFETGRSLLDNVAAIGEDNCFFETDFPHPTCLYPRPLSGIAQTFAEHDVPWELRAKLLGGNAAKVYNIDLPPIQAPDDGSRR